MSEHLSNDARVTFEPALPQDGPVLASLRVEAMRDSLERVGRFDAERARARLLDGYSAEHTRHILHGGRRVGFVVLRPQPRGLLLDHLYVRPGFQGRGIGAAVLADVQAQARAMGVAAVFVGALKQSDSNRFYRRHGFEQVEETDFDLHYVWRPDGGGATRG